mmetsp:Transcript_29469/g.75509  ORF Transcript_29469/g.75509 Transcript_29469/m.75509 type:complete len:450 (-) Transcript_29469:19-1368(-)
MVRLFGAAVVAAVHLPSGGFLQSGDDEDSQELRGLSAADVIATGSELSTESAGEAQQELTPLGGNDPTGQWLSPAYADDARSIGVEPDTVGRLGKARANPRDGFNTPVQFRPSLRRDMSRVLTDLSYEESKLRSASGFAVEEELTAQRPRLKKKLKENAKKQADKFSQSLSPVNAKAAAKKSYLNTRLILVKKAFDLCGSSAPLSRMPKLPARCGWDAREFLAPVEQLSVNTWAPAAASATQAKTSLMAEKAAYRAVRDMPATIMPRYAYANANLLFNQEWEKIKDRYKAKAESALLRFERSRASFWKKARLDMVKKMKALVRKTIWAKPVQLANKRIDVVARKTADRFSLRIAKEQMAPHFVKAAQDVLERSVKHANKRMINDWNATWALRRTETSGGLPPSVQEVADPTPLTDDWTLGPTDPLDISQVAGWGAPATMPTVQPGSEHV